MLRFFISSFLFVSLHCYAEPREVFSSHSPTYLRTVGKLIVPSSKYENSERRAYNEYCTATLVASSYILSGWHCLEAYNDLSKRIEFVLPNVENKPVREARLIASGGDMSADWAILKLQDSIEFNVGDLLPIENKDDSQQTGTKLLSAGFSRDDGLGQNGAVLSYHQNCTILHREEHRVATNCLAFKGASGGPVFYQNKIIGVMSAGDSESLSYYIPSSQFYNSLKRFLE